MPSYPLRRLAAIIGLALPCAAWAQSPLERQLTGGSSKAWSLQKLVRPPVAGDACISGATYTFAASHDVQVTRCLQGRLVTSHHAWSVQDDPTGGATLAVNGVGTFAIMVPGVQPGQPRLRLHATKVMPGWPGGDLDLGTDED